MATEIEYKFVVTRLPAIPPSNAIRIQQGYLALGTPSVRVRLKGPKGFVTIKAVRQEEKKGQGRPKERLEFEYEIPTPDAVAMLSLCPLRIEKTRYLLENGIELDVFDGTLGGLILAEFEVPTPDTPPPDPPEGWKWIDVSQDASYSNRALAETGLPKNAVKCRIG